MKKWIGTLIYSWPIFVMASPPPNLVIMLSAGPAWYQANQNQTIFLQSDYTNAYIANNRTQVLSTLEVFLGKQYTVSSMGLSQLGITYSTSSPAHLQGHVWQAAEAAFDNFVYQYHIKHQHIAIAGKLLSTQFNKTVLPYLSGSLGVGFNRSYYYSETPIIFEAITPAPFTHHYQTTFTYTIGTGLQKLFSQHLQLGIGYELSNWGKSNLGPADGQTSASGLRLNLLYAHQLQVSLAYVS